MEAGQNGYCHHFVTGCQIGAGGHSSSNFLLITSLKSSMMINWVLPWLRQMTIRIEVVFDFIFLGPNALLLFMSQVCHRLDCFHFYCAIVDAATNQRRRSNSSRCDSLLVVVASLRRAVFSVNGCWYSDQMRIEFIKRPRHSNLVPLCRHFNSLLASYKKNNNKKCIHPWTTINLYF